MAKIDFQQVERILEEGLRQYGIKQLQYLAELNDSFLDGELDREGPFDDIEIRAISLNTLFRNLQIFKKKDPELYQKLNIDRKKMKFLIENPNKITDTEWNVIKRIQQQLNHYRKELRGKLAKVKDEDIIRSERKKQRYKRFNTKDSWIPLH